MNKLVQQVAKAEQKSWVVHVTDAEGNVLLHRNGFSTLPGALQWLMHQPYAKAVKVEVYCVER